MTTPSAPKRYLRRSGINVHQLPDESLLLLDEAADMVFPLNQAGTLIWHLCDGTRDQNQVIQSVIDTYDAPPVTIAQDTQQFLNELLRLGLILDTLTEPRHAKR